MREKNILVFAGIVTFNPDIQVLKNNIDSIVNQVQVVVIFDNGSRNVFQIKKLISNYKDCICIGSRTNKGIAYALNKLCEWGLEHSYNWVITLDQDSVSPCDLIDCLKKYTGSKVAIVAPNIVYKNNEKYTHYSKKSYDIVQWVITSASLTNLKVWEKIGGFDEWLFIDGVDYDFGIRANNAGYKIIRTYDAQLYHELGNLKCISMLGKVIYVTNHSSFRKYYMTRNTIYLRKKLKTGKPIRTIVKYLVKLVFFEDNKKEKMWSIMRGIHDGLKSGHEFY